MTTILRKRLRTLIMGHNGSGKSQALLDLAIQFPDVTVHVFDMEDSVMPLLVRRGSVPPNLELYREWPEEFGDAMTAFKAKCKEVREVSDYGDWIAFDVADYWWQLAADGYIGKQYGDRSAYLTSQIGEAMAKSEAEKGRKSYKPLSFGGLVADEWQVIRGDYYMTIPKTLGASCKANVAISVIEKVPMFEKHGSDITFKEALPPQYRTALIKPGGEKGLTGQVDTVIRLRHENPRKWEFSTIGKNRLGLEVDWSDFTNQTVWESILGGLDWPTDVSPGRE